MGVKDYDLNPDNNTQINGINIAEGCPPSGINNAVRQIMADVKADSDAQNEALKNFSETPASAEELGPVKVGDGLTMGEDGILSADLATADVAGRVKASVAALAGAVPVGGEDGYLDKSWTWEVGEYRIAHAESMDGGLLCHGAAVSRTTYNRLFSKIGTKFGEGDGKTTFNLPDFRNRTLWGADDNLGTVIEAGLPGIDGTFGEGYLDENNMPATGAFGRKSGGAIRISGTDASSNVGTYTFDASQSSDIYGKSDTVQTPAIAVNVFIKY